jgi:acyl-CoA synthetase (AMP-forming)/AMP-acid ligase II
VATAFGILKAGAVLNPLNPVLGEGEIGFVLGHAEPRVVVTGAESAAAILAAWPRCAVAAFGSAEGTIALDDLLARSPEDPVPVAVSGGDPSTLLYTSGTTGTPKGVLFTHGRTGASGPHFIAALGLTDADTILAVTPLFHGNAWGAVVTALWAGGTVAFPKAFHASAFWLLVHETGATVLYTLGTILAMLLARPPSNLERRSPLRVILGLGSAPIRERVIERFGVTDVVDCFGSTDAGVVTIVPAGTPPRPAPAGRRCPASRSASPTTRAGRLRRARWGRSGCARPRAWPPTFATRRRRRRRCATTGFSPATSGTWTRTAGSTSSTASAT